MKKGDIIIITIITIAIGGFFGYRSYKDANKELACEYDKCVNIYYRDDLYKSIELTEDTEMEFTLEFAEGFNDVHIYDGGVEVTEADCPNKLDVKQGFIDQPGIPIICLPHYMVIEIEETNPDNDDDGIDAVGTAIFGF